MNTIESENELETSKKDDSKYEIEIEDYLKSLSIPFEVHSHEALYTMEACESIEKKYGVPIPKNLFLANRQQTQFYLLLMPANKIFKTKELSSQIQSARLSFGNEDALFNYLKVKRGSCTPLGLYFDRENRVQFLIDKDILSYDEIAVHPLTNTKTLVIKTKDLLDIFLKNVNHSYIAVELRGE